MDPGKKAINQGWATPDIRVCPGLLLLLLTNT
jgi:hypothetical protein